MPADGLSLPPKKGDLGTSRWGLLRGLGYINHAIDGREHDRLWHQAAENDVRSYVGFWG
jgi:hypothetical protein